MRQTRRSIAPLPLLALVWSCSGTPPPVLPDPMDAVREQLAQAGALTLRGCYRCLVEARDVYDDLARQGFETDEGAAGLLRTTLLIGMREREMGLPGGGTFERAAALAGLEVSLAGEAADAREAAGGPEAREAGEDPETPGAGESPEAAREAGEAGEAAEAAENAEAGETAATGGAPSAGPEWERFLQIAATTLWQDVQDVGVPKDLSEENVYARAIADRDRDAWNAVLQPLVPADPLAAYLYLSLNCTSEWLAEQPPELAEVLAAHDDAVYVRYRLALCADEQVALAAFHLGRVHIEEARWIETASAFTRAALCFRESAGRLADALIELEQDPTLADDRRARIVERRTAELAVVRRQAASSFYNAALGYYNDGTLPIARRYAVLAGEHEMFAERATRLVGLIDALPATGHQR